MPTATSFSRTPGPFPSPAPAPAPATAPVVLDHVGKRYGRRPGVQALDGVSVAFPPGTLTAVLGVSGSGKSTLLQCAAGLDRPDTGTVRLTGVDVSRLSRRKLTLLRRRRVGFVFQALNLVPTLTVAENIALPLRLDRRRVDRRHVADLAGRVGLGDKLRRMPATLSGGQQQRVAIARALVAGPDVVFADEPTGALDPATAEGVLRLLRAAVDDLGQTVVVVTHDPVITRFADRAVFLDRGRVAHISAAPDPAQVAARLHSLAGPPELGGAAAGEPR